MIFLQELYFLSSQQQYNKLFITINYAFQISDEALVRTPNTLLEGV